MLILGIESSCDETAAAVIEDGVRARSNIVASQVATHRPYGGVVPELASREHLRNIGPIVKEAIAQAGVELKDIDALAATQGPGLIGSLLVGICYAKSLALVFDRTLLGINHIEGHIYSTVFENPPVEYPALALVVSGGHTSLFLVPAPLEYRLIGRTRDDAAGEAYDKVAKLLGLGYPGGPILDRLAQTGDGRSFQFSIPRMSDGTGDFSFSGLKTAVVRCVKKGLISPTTTPDSPGPEIANLAASFQRTVVRTLRQRVEQAIDRYDPKTLIVAGGVACNSALRQEMKELGAERAVPVHLPSPIFTTDNAAMIAAAAYPRLLRGEATDWTFTAESTMSLQNLQVEDTRNEKRLRYRSS